MCKNHDFIHLTHLLKELIVREMFCNVKAHGTNHQLTRITTEDDCAYTTFLVAYLVFKV